MDNRGSNHSASSYVKPLVISFAGIIFCTLALAAYHFIVMRCCVRLQHMQQQQQQQRRRNNNDNNRNHNKNSCRVQEEFLNQIPVIKYTINTRDHAFGFDQSECSICLGELEDGDLVRQLPPCNHVFHNHCIDPWFKEHESCPFCRSPITCECESMVPTALENAGQQRVSHENPSDHHQLMDDDVSGSISTSRLQQPRHSLCISSHISSHMHKKPQVLGMWLKRSLSMNQSSSHIAITIQRDQEINCECESRVPTASENAAQQRVSHENPSDHHHQLIDDDVSDSTSTSRLQQPRHSLYISSHMQKKPQVSGMSLKRSLSMDQSCNAITNQRDQEIAPTSASTKWFVMSQYNYKPKPLKHLDHMRLSSFSKLRNSRSGRSNGIFSK